MVSDGLVDGTLRTERRELRDFEGACFILLWAFQSKEKTAID